MKPKRVSAPNPAYVEAMQLLRRSGAAGTHGDVRLKRLRTRGEAKRASLKEWTS
jgi:hypothetical protein